MGRLNLSDWGIRHPQLLAFLILVIGLSGAFAYSRLGRAEDPAFTIKTAVVSVEWPGATAAEMQGQVADRIEKKLQELPWVDKIDSYYKPAFASISLNFRDSTPPRDVPMLFLELRKKMSVFCRTCRPVCSDPSSTTSSAMSIRFSTRSWATALHTRN